jgi:hypothetical protein
MAGTNPTGGQQVVPLDLPDLHILILRDTLADCLEGVQGDLELPGGMKDPEQGRREADAYQRLLAGLVRGQLPVPDEAARAAIEAIAKGDDRASEYAEVVANHDALHGLLGLLGGEAS